MFYPSSFEEKIGFDAIRTLLSERCLSAMGRNNVKNLIYSSHFEVVEKQLKQTYELKQILLFEDPFPAQDYHDLRETLSRIAIDGTYIELEELADLRNLIRTVIDIIVYCRILHEDDKYPNMWELCQDIIPEKGLLSSINRILDPKGNLRDDASDELRQIKSAIIRISNDADKRIRKVLSSAKQEGIVKEDAEMTVRNGRLCIPIIAQFKRRMQGFIHDESATGQTVFIEPTEVFSANNELKDLYNAEKREIVKILTAISNEIRTVIPNLQTYHQFIGKIDFTRAKALLAIDINAGLPHLIENSLMQWHKAIHPLLYLKLKEVDKKVVPLDLELTPQHRILIISGPNAGGKSVTLKTIGLLQYMLQCGLLVPMEETSEMSLFEDFFIDIGDEQSIENDLSTYSSHLYNLKVMVEQLHNRALFLIDEFGAGTEPSLGGAMAEASLEAIYQTGAFGIITTHYGNLKVFPDHFPEAINGAMLFDTNNLQPLFLLKIGNPGSSFTYEIAQKIGFPDDIIAAAIEKSGTAQIDYERKLQEIEVAQLEINQRLKMIRAADDQLAEMIQEYSEKFSELESHRKDILQKAKNQATSIIDSANKVIEKTIREIKEANGDPIITRTIRKETAQAKENLRTEIEHIEQKEAPKPVIPLQHATHSAKTKHAIEDTPIRIGDSVFMSDIQTVGEVTALNGQDVTVSFNSISFRTSLKKLTKISKKDAKTIQKHGVRVDGTSVSDMMNKKIANFQHTLDIRGVRAEEAIAQLEYYLDEASLLSIHQVKILHGKGNGILRNVVRQQLAKRNDIADFYDEALELGGYGITIVNLK